MKKQIVLTLTLDVTMNPKASSKVNEEQEVQQVVDKVQHHFNKDLSNTDVTPLTHIKTAFVKVSEVVDMEETVH